MVTTWLRVCSAALAMAFAPPGFYTVAAAAGDSPAEYVGSETCQGCHEDQYHRFATFSKKAHSFDSIAKMQPKLTAAEFKACFACHTTGYGKPGGFRSLQETPQLKNAGCEACHGPGSLHAESGDPADLQGSVTLERCSRCHTSERVNSFHYKPIKFAGAH